METLNLNCEKRELGTKGKVRSLRRVGKVPASFTVPRPLRCRLRVAGLSLKASVTGDASQRLLKLQAAEYRPQRPPCDYQGRAARADHRASSSMPICTRSI